MIHDAVGLTVVVGGQYGSEGKGKIVSYLSLKKDAAIAVRCGGPNSGHTVDYRGERHALRLLPAGFINKKTRLLIAAGAVINTRILFEDIAKTRVDPSRVGIDKNAVIITDEDSNSERKLNLNENIGSTLSGTGIGVARRVIRDPSLKLAKDIEELQPVLTDVSAEVNQALDQNAEVIIEGTQGFGLSVYHTPYFPYATSRDTTVAGFLSEVGVSPRLVNDVIMCVRTYPIRVAGNSGPLVNETSWEDLRLLSGYPYPICEYTTTTNKIRRVALFDIHIVRRASMINRPTMIALHGADYLDYRNKSLVDYESLTSNAKTFITELEKVIKVPVMFIGTGPTNEELIDREIGRFKENWLPIKNQ